MNEATTSLTRAGLSVDVHNAIDARARALTV